MSTFEQLATNQVLISAITGWFIAQVLKTIIDLWYTKSFSLERLWGSGGMPSSHSATVCGLAVAAACRYGLSSFEFGVSMIFAIVVMHDAMGVRRETGKQARILNIIMRSEVLDREHPWDFEETLKEFVGHTPLQVLMGAILGTLIALVLNNLMYS
ncbi:MAG: divergent PAP2 family protein [Johnsonella sp.]|nr:divergent PAP2 family protein [Johnsonella sp.]